MCVRGHVAPVAAKRSDGKVQLPFTVRTVKVKASQSQYHRTETRDCVYEPVLSCSQ